MTAGDGSFAIEVVEAGPSPVDERPVFFYDLGDPECYLAAERIMAALGALDAVPEWVPVLGPELELPSPSPDRRLIELRASELGLQPIRWPARWPATTRTAMLTATYAKHVGRAVAFSLAAFRQAFAGGHDLGEQSTVLLAAAACEMHPAAVLKAIELRGVREGLAGACERARASGVTALPAIEFAGAVFTGAGAVEAAAEAVELACR